mmetsp:Transcript_63663/g.149220  ORF Transcript_63663/g.149220 Transcript_63663/m.149220 type:complete len:210 (-) Transcript_63663:78-707(-)
MSGRLGCRAAAHCSLPGSVAAGCADSNSGVPDRHVDTSGFSIEERCGLVSRPRTSSRCRGLHDEGCGDGRLPHFWLGLRRDHRWWKGELRWIGVAMFCFGCVHLRACCWHSMHAPDCSSSCERQRRCGRGGASRTAGRDELLSFVASQRCARKAASVGTSIFCYSLAHQNAFHSMFWLQPSRGQSDLFLATCKTESALATSLSSALIDL